MTDTRTEHTSGNGNFMIGGSVWPGLSKLIEECGEVLQVGGKLMGSAGDTAHWSGDLSQMLVEELGDLLAAAGFFMDVNGLDVDAVLARSVKKRATFEKWHADTLGAAPAKAIEARRAETGTGSVHESAVPKAFAQNIPGDPA